MAMYLSSEDQGPKNNSWTTKAIEDLKQQCVPKAQADGDDRVTPAEGDAASPYIIPLISTIGKQLFVSVLKDKEKKLEALKKASTKSYSHTFFSDANELKTIKCIAVRRTSKVDSKEPENLLAVLKLIPLGDGSNGFYIQPILLRANTAIVPTSVNNPNVNISFAISLKTLAPRENGLLAIDEYASAALTVASVKLDNSTNCTDQDKPCNPSEILPFQNNSMPVSITVAVTEQGNLGIDFDQRKAELEARKEAYGSAIYEGIKAGLED